MLQLPTVKVGRTNNYIKFFSYSLCYFLFQTTEFKSKYTCTCTVLVTIMKHKNISDKSFKSLKRLDASANVNRDINNKLFFTHFS